MIARVDTKPEIHTHRRYAMETTHLFGIQAKKERELCEAHAPAAT